MSIRSHRAPVFTAVAMALLLLFDGGLAGAQTVGSPFEYPLDVRYDVRIEMRDGVELSADVYTPLEPGRYPTVFVLTPYDNNPDNAMSTAWNYIERGYAYVTVDVRGRYDSDGVFDPWRDDREDGSDVISWIAERSWSNGKVATVGGSYTAMNQWLMAAERNPHHIAMVSRAAPANGFVDFIRWGGVPKLDLMYTWLMGMFGRARQPLGGVDWEAVMWHLPINELDSVAGRNMTAWRDWAENDVLNEFWDKLQIDGTYGNFDIPSLNLTGWWDGQLLGVTKHFIGAVETGRSEDHALIIGPWLHGINRDRRIGDRDYGPQAIIPQLGRWTDAWLDHQVFGSPRPDIPNVMYFLQVKNEWRTAEGWPIPGTEFTSYYLDSGGSANTLFGDGELNADRPGTGEPDSFSYDPRNPVPTISNRTTGTPPRGAQIPQGSVDNRAAQTRPDVLVYTTEPLTEGLEITGPIEAVIYFSTDVPDTDITVKLLDVLPDGRAMNVSNGIKRARYRDSYRTPTFLEPGEVYVLEIELYPTSNYFEAGNRIQIEVSSSNFPNYARNLNTRESSDTGTRMRVAETTIHHSAEYPSHIRLPVIPAGVASTWGAPSAGTRSR